MARFPKIDRPCPLTPAEQRRIDGHCSRCGCTVHSLDGMDDAARSARLRAASGPMCVSYRLAAGLGAALALSIAGPAAAGPVEADETVDAAPPATDAVKLSVDPGFLEYIFVGGVDRPEDATWIDDGTLPDLPTRPATPDDAG